MSDIQALIQRLREQISYSTNQVILKLLDTVEFQAKQIEELQREIGECSGGYQTLEREVASLKDALSLVIVRHEEWAAQMPAGQFDDPLSDAVEKARPFARTGQIKELMKDARRYQWLCAWGDVLYVEWGHDFARGAEVSNAIDTAMQAEEGKI